MLRTRREMMLGHPHRGDIETGGPETGSEVGDDRASTRPETVHHRDHGGPS